jgi:hypothetical protein
MQDRYAVTPTDSTESELQDLLVNSRVFIKLLNSYRLEKFNNKQKIFELHLKEDFPFRNSTLPVSYQRELAIENAHFWAQSIYRFLTTQETGVFSKPPLKTTKNAAKHYSSLKPTKEHLVITESDISITEVNGEPVLKIDRPFEETNPLEFTINEDTIPEITSGEKIVLLYKSDTVHIQPYQSIQSIYTSQQTLKEKTTEEYKDLIAEAYTYMLASGSPEVIPIKTTTESPQFPELFDSLDLFYRKIYESSDEQLYLLSRSERGLNRINTFLTKQTITASDIVELLQIPESLFDEYYSDDLVLLDSDYDRYSCEEFLVYGYMKDSLTAEDLMNFVFIPYRPPKKKSELKYACQLGTQIGTAIDSLPKIEDHEEITDSIVKYAKLALSMGSKPPLSIDIQHLKSPTASEKEL